MSLSLRVVTIAIASVLALVGAQRRPITHATSVSYGTGTWQADSLGNHRVVLHVDAPLNATPRTHPEAVHAYIPWRRRDDEPEKKNIIVVDATTGTRVMNVARVAISRESGDLVFQPATMPGDYYVYFMPFRRANKSANYPKIVYQAPEPTADATWLSRNQLNNTNGDDAWRSLPAARVVRYQSVDSLDAFTPMEIIATRSETQALLARNPKSTYLVFPEDRSNSIRMATDLPQRWIETGADAAFHGNADRGEFYVFQLGVFAARQSLADVRSVFSDLTGPGGHVIPASRIESFNTGGVNWIGQPFTKVVTVDQGHVQPLWIGTDIPVDASPGDYSGIVT
ncbi:MAG TPA: glycoside hydrolase domain-containing protein, partial [Gemmatimonadaceae bacterium]